MPKLRDLHQYDDIIHLPRHSSPTRAPMPQANRAAQFMPFAALTGYDDAVKEEARLTEQKIELDDDALQQLNERLWALQAMLPDAPEIQVTYFVADPQKLGGAYRQLSGRIKRIDPAGGRLVLRGGAVIPFDNILRIESAAFRS